MKMEENREASADAEVRALIDRWVEGARKGNVPAVMECYTPDVLAFDAILALQFKGADAYRAHWEACMEHMQGDMVFEVHELGVETSGELAFAHYVVRCGGADEEGQVHVSWMRGTVCCRKTSAGWRIAHEHYSMPVDPMTNSIVSDLAPC